MVTTVHTASDFVSEATTGNSTSIDIAAPPEAVWEALVSVRSGQLRVTTPLMAVRSLPAMVRKRGSLKQRSTSPHSLIDSMKATRFVELHRAEPNLLTLGLVGQFWKLDGGRDANVSDADAFATFDEPGFVRSAVDFVVEPTPSGSRLSTTTCNRATDSATERTFGRYWTLIGWGSKAIRVDLLRAVRRIAEKNWATSCRRQR